MKKQKICVIGDGLSGLAATLILSQLDVKIDFISKNDQKKKIDDRRTTAISPSNYNFLSKYLNYQDRKYFWACKKISLFYEKLDQLNNFINFSENKKNLLYIIRNNLFKKILFTKIREKKNIKIIKNEVKKINTEKSQITLKNKKYSYDLILLCLGRNSKIITEIVGKRHIKDNSEEIAFTSIVKHKSNISNPQQYFLKEGPLAILPINKNTFSFVWSVSQKFQNKNIMNLASSKIKKVLKLKNISIQKPDIFPISFKINTNFSKKNIIVLGDGFYNVHPVAGQGFNLITRDIINLFNLIKNNQLLGLPIKDSLIIKNFVNSRKPENLLFGLGISITNNFFKHNKYTSPLKEFILKDINKFKFMKEISIKISDKGIFQSLK